jgi:spore coat protein U-like protein
MKIAPIQIVIVACVLVSTSPVGRAAGCTVGTSGLSFGNYDVFSTINDDVTATINVNCPGGTGYVISLSSGSGTYASRTMTNGANILAYNLFLDPTHLTIWGDGSAGTGTLSGTGTGNNTASTVYGRIPAGQNASVGAYSDIVTVTVTF